MPFFRDFVRRLFGGPSPEPPAQSSPPIPGPPAPKPPSPPTADAEMDRLWNEPPPDSKPDAGPAKSKSKAKSKAQPAQAPGLEAGDFLPIARDELKSAAKGSGRELLRDVWAGRRDQIPPLDERTLLIDRAMVAQGLLSPEELAEIHRVGAEMARVRPIEEDIRRQGRLAGEAAVKADLEERARIKAEKRAEAAERKRLHAEKVADRFANDIIFLGRGVSRFLNDRTSDLGALEAAGLPPLSTPAELAEAIGLSVPRLRWLAFHAEAATRVHYVEFQVPKKNGGTRTLSAPHRTLAAVQRWINDRVVALLPVEPEAHGFVPARGILTNARLHAGRAVVVNLDLQDFFPSIGYRRVRSVFRRAGYSPAVATILGLLCTESPRRRVVFDGTTYFVATGPRGLPQGASTSPGLSNQVARRLDRRLAGLAGKLDATYTRYADDLTFSGDSALDARVGYLLARVRHLARAEGFAVNEAKTRVLRQNAAQVVTGLVVNDRPGVARVEVRRLRALLHRAKSEGLDAQNRDNHPDFRAHLRGKIAYISMARPEAGARLLEAFMEVVGEM